MKEFRFNTRLSSFEHIVSEKIRLQDKLKVKGIFLLFLMKNELLVKGSFFSKKLIQSESNELRLNLLLSL